MTDGFRKLMGIVVGLPGIVVIVLLWGILFALPAILLYLPSLGHSWKWANFGMKLVNRLPFSGRLDSMVFGSE